MRPRAPQRRRGRIPTRAASQKKAACPKKSASQRKAANHDPKKRAPKKSRDQKGRLKGAALGFLARP
eukprot:7104809-Pyramimonas_sp.AAC.1